MTASAKRAFQVLGTVLLVLGAMDIFLALIGLEIFPAQYSVAAALVVTGLLMVNWKKEAVTAAAMLAAGNYLYIGTTVSKIIWYPFAASAVVLFLLLFDRYDVWNKDRKIGKLNHPEAGPFANDTPGAYDRLASAGSGPIHGFHLPHGLSGDLDEHGVPASLADRPLH